mgnify:CR=1 FL=1
MAVFFKKIYTIRLKMFIKRVNFGVFLGSEHGEGLAGSGLCYVVWGFLCPEHWSHAEAQRRRGGHCNRIYVLLYESSILETVYI